MKFLDPAGTRTIRALTPRRLALMAKVWDCIPRFPGLTERCERRRALTGCRRPAPGGARFKSSSGNIGRTSFADICKQVEAARPADFDACLLLVKPVGGASESAAGADAQDLAA